MLQIKNIVHYSSKQYANPSSLSFFQVHDHIVKPQGYGFVSVRGEEQDGGADPDES